MDRNDLNWAMSAVLRSRIFKMVLVTAFLLWIRLRPDANIAFNSWFRPAPSSLCNQRHVTEDKLNDAIASVINGYNQLLLPKIWGLGKHPSADGTKWDLHAQNLMSEYHLRYSGYDGYYMVSDMYIALFFRFTTCGSWEGHNILDYLVENDSDVQRFFRTVNEMFLCNLDSYIRHKRSRPTLSLDQFEERFRRFLLKI